MQAPTRWAMPSRSLPEEYVLVIRVADLGKLLLLPVPLLKAIGLAKPLPGLRRSNPAGYCLSLDDVRHFLLGWVSSCFAGVICRPRSFLTYTEAHALCRVRVAANEVRGVRKKKRGPQNKLHVRTFP